MPGIRRRLTALPSRLAATYSGRIPSYRRVYTDAIDALIPASKGDGEQWGYNDQDEAKIAAYYGLTPAAHQAEPVAISVAA